MSLSERVEGLVHAETQVEAERVDLTVDTVSRVGTAGRVDFGGSELADAVLEPVETDRRAPDDDYGWWDLDPGQYVVRFNESLRGDRPVRLEPRPALVERGGLLPTVTTASLAPVPLGVPETTGDAGLRVKENARVATLHPVD